MQASELQEAHVLDEDDLELGIGHEAAADWE